MYSTGRVHMNTCDFKREHVIRSDNVWLSEVMSGTVVAQGIAGTPVVDFRIPNGISCEHWRAVLPHSNPRAYPWFSQESHKIFTRITQEFPRFSQEFHRSSQEFHKSTTQNSHGNPAEITSEFHAKALEYVCHTGRTHRPPENSC